MIVRYGCPLSVWLHLYQMVLGYQLNAFASLKCSQVSLRSLLFLSAICRCTAMNIQEGNTNVKLQPLSNLVDAADYHLSGDVMNR